MNFTNPFRLPTADTITKQQRDEAERQLLMHEAAREHHEAMTGMYRARIARLGGATVDLHQMKLPMGTVR